MTYTRDELEAAASVRGPTVKRLISIILTELDARKPTLAAIARSDSDEVLRRK